jgi:DNA-directed RNA polymerase specialized sigma24 family protein
MSDVIDLEKNKNVERGSVNNIEEALASTAYSNKFRRLCRYKTDAILGSFVGHESSAIDEITDDAIGLASERTLKWIRKLTECEVSEILSSFDPNENDIRAYMYKIVEREAFKRYRRWSTNTKTGKLGYAARSSQTIEDDDDVDQKAFDEWIVEKNAELFPLNNRTDFKAVDLVDVLSKNGVSEDVIDYIRLKIIGGVTYEELSGEYKQSQSKYAKAIDRALKKAKLK